MLTMTASILALLAISGFFAGMIGALVGIGGGLILVPLLVLGFGLEIKIAVAASLVAVVASSTAAGSVYVGKGLANMRLGMVLEIATTLGGISGSLVAMLVSDEMISGLFSILMLVTAFLTLRSKDAPSNNSQTSTLLKTDVVRMGHEEVGKLAGSYYDPFLKHLVHYQAIRLQFGSAVSFLAGILSGMLGVGGGFMKVPAMAVGMKVPIKVAAATSNFMIGVTAISSLFVYFARGFVLPMVAAPLAVGVVGGSLWGTKLAQKVSPMALRKMLALILVLVSLQMLFKTCGVHLGK